MPDVVPFLSSKRIVNKLVDSLPNKPLKLEEKTDTFNIGFSYSSDDFRACQSLMDSLVSANNKILNFTKLNSCDALKSIVLSKRGVDDVFGTQTVPTNVNGEPFGSPSHK